MKKEQSESPRGQPVFAFAAKEDGKIKKFRLLSHF